MSHRPAYTGLGVIAFYLAALLGLSFYARRRIGPLLWRKLHRATVVVYVLGVIHTLGAGTDAHSQWLRVLMLASGAPIVFLFCARLLGPPPRPARRPVQVERAP